MLYNGMLGLGVGAIHISYYPDRGIWLPLGVCVLVGLSNTFKADTILQFILRGLNVRIENNDTDKS